MVMATGVVSTDLAAGGWKRLSVALLTLAAVAWLALLVRGDVPRELAGVAATAVLGTRLAMLGWTAAAWTLAAAAAALWMVRVPRASPPRRSAGADFLPAVATQALAVLAALLDLDVVGTVLFVFGLALYARVVIRFDAAQLRRGDGDQWIAGGALAISSLAGAELGLAGAPLIPWRGASVALAGAATAWLPALVASELARPRLAGAPSRWATVFPLGMYAAMSYAVGALAGLHWLRAFARGVTWLAAVVWALVLADAVRRSGRRRAPLD